MSHDISVETCCNVEINKETIDRFDVFDYVPQGYETKKYDYGVPSRNMAANLTGKKAPEWTLNDIKESPVSLSDLKSKVILVNITGIGCGACQASIPFLKELKRKYGNPNFNVDRRKARKKGALDLLEMLGVFQSRPYIVEEKCKKCGVCVESCPVEGKAVRFDNGRRNPPVYDYKKCIRCFCCQEMCPHQAIQVKKHRLPWEK